MKNKKLTIFLIIILSLLALLVIGFMIVLMSGKFNFLNFKSYKGVSENLEIEETYDIDFNEININVEAGNIYIKKSENEQVKVVVYSDEEKSTVTTNNNTLSVDVNAKKCNFFCINTVISKVEVYLPSNYSNKINIENNFGDIEIEEFMNATIDIEENYGDIKVSEVNDIKVHNDFGKVEIDKVNKADIEVSAGDIKIENVNEINAENNLGDIKIKNINGYLSIINDCGDIELDNVVLTKDSNIKSDLGDIDINEIKDVYIDVKTDIGNAKINNNYRESEITLEIENDLGDIKIDN